MRFLLAGMTWANESTMPSMKPYSRASAAVYQWSCKESSKIRGEMQSTGVDSDGHTYIFIICISKKTYRIISSSQLFCPEEISGSV